MFNKCVLMGRLCKDLELRTVKAASGDFSAARFSIAVERPKKSGEESAGVDYISCTGTGRIVETIAKFLHKADLILVSGWWKTGFYEKKDGTKAYTNELQIEDFSFCGYSKKQSDEDELPFV